MKMILLLLLSSVVLLGCVQPQQQSATATPTVSPTAAGGLPQEEVGELLQEDDGLDNAAEQMRQVE